ncbi:MAG: coenzyme A pyrophosphatase [Gammaproteobacteria bacterium]|nr:coenzyme A pyrophosphatase [Gammaproteobacteria bacterium]|tara:strand:+ start:397 stop:1008 length:612 start_codon:yes stop_codon:yes gene_type:complete
MPLTIERIAKVVSDHEPAHYERHADTRWAAVAIILKQSDDHTEALFILRAKHDGDPWSGHMAFPGGHREPADENLRQTAEREILEEIGLDLVQDARFIGEIDSVRANPRGRNLDLVVTPFVYALENEQAQFKPNYEVAKILWGSLNDMYSGDSITVGEFHVLGERHRYSGYDVHGEVVWGLTYRMLDLFFGVLDPDWDPHDDF